MASLQRNLSTSYGESEVEVEVEVSDSQRIKNQTSLLDKILLEDIQKESTENVGSNE